jgi:type VI secretion system protein ImpJ
MKLLSKVVWSEGMYLGPHHFQAQARFYEESIQFATEALWYEAWGLTGCELDQEALRNGSVSVLGARGIMPDGMVFDVPDCDAGPPPREAVLLPTANTLTVQLAVPARRAGGVNCKLNGDAAESDARYTSVASKVCDENTGRDETTLDIGRKNLRLLFDAEPSEGFVTLPVARVMRSGAGRLVYDPSFIPPCMRLSSSERLMSLLRRLIEILDEKSSTLSYGKSRGKQFAAGPSAADIANFWFLHGVNSSLTVLRHLYAAKRGHPEELFREMSRLAGALCTFGLDVHPRALPQYDHLHLDRCFGDLDDHIRRHLEIIVPASALQIPVAPAAPYFWEGDIADQRCIGRARWVLAIHAGATESEIILRAPKVVKLCSAKFVPELVKRALPGLELTHLPVPPTALSARVEMQYFGVSRTGPCWDHIVMTRRVGIYVPVDLPSPEIELFVIPEN